ncbi:MAG: hypothetical protein US83_C0005G0004 [Candidatus Falkowbacteria bacterium GW2011_GWC2_38_22]|uniref:Glycosyl transferase family 1 domain-containing protein n=1 Tax=Candidatus Falkowbacteria bacterium GW2011_GWE1_38_31 TaxID=1618638 RepID=A0A0G0K4K4_9BACT|nr:MAG: hypothetical protein US73_C0003G0090 [Candidatus Falkowbacteria bacterium GW2011_GWF2_38_1205]KKQ61491.1 MAG: hypothetical protein US83_C0005G0004 [Candidatus Falkowbacteria bacterium GW2011_GWC2_38_22]KKQ63616.1 MAG: hypothetical protein US84_C0005G0090 [Candidatus Falkowbacteria bacterium GW2011_GWF1_38_22]KKQ65768.1 MAG: hypothetical protein US87_C0005G0090 [Candidatus Falkowbacteria bacterium GW2011_GWE2_38_254]KKQ70385.1 MAG: hypothetical protein US91_C0005G0090 [Candidatus Falkowb
MTTSVIQALATGLPCIATIHSAFPDQIIDNKNGFLVNEGDYEALAERILYCMDHSEFWPEYGRYGRELAMEKYDAKSLIDTQVDCYHEIVKSVL